MNRLLLALLLVLPLAASGHGVERGTIRKALAQFGMPAATKDRVLEAVKQRCNVAHALAVEADIEERNESIDQGIVDSYYTITFRFFFEDAMPTERVVVEVAEYQISNPAIDPIEILSVQSPLCP